MRILIVALFIAGLSSLTRAEDIEGKYFKTKEQYEHACYTLLSDASTNSVSTFFRKFSGEDTLSKDAEQMVLLIDFVKNNSGNFEYIQKVGEKKLAMAYIKDGYIIKYEKSFIFCEFTIEYSGDGYKLLAFNFQTNNKPKDLLEKIPDYCWE